MSMSTPLAVCFDCIRDNRDSSLLGRARDLRSRVHAYFNLSQAEMN